MAGVLETLSVNIVGEISDVKKAFSDLDSDVAGLGKSLGSIGQSMTALGTGLTTHVTAPILAIGAGVVLAANQIDDAYDTIRVGTGATGDALIGLQDDFHAVFGEVPASAQEVGTAIADLNTRLGLTGVPLQEMSTQFLELSRITGTDVSSNIENVTRVFGDWGISADQQSEKLDYLFKVSQATGIGIDALSQQMVQYGAPLRQMGFDYDTAAALVGKFNKEGVNSELVMGSLRIALGKMANEGITDANQALELYVEQIKNAGSAGEANAIAIEVFGARAGPDMAAAIREGRFEVEDLVATLQASPETILTASEATKDLSEMMAEMKAKVIEAVEPLGTSLRGALESLEPYLNSAVDALTKVVECFTNLPGPAQAVIALMVGLAAAIGPVLVAAGVLISSVGAIVGALGTAGLGGALTTVVGILTGPVAIAIAAFAAAAYIVYKNWDTIGPIVSSAVDSMRNAFDSMMAFIQPLIDQLSAFVNESLQSLSAWWGTNGPAITQAASTLGGVLLSVFETVGAVIAVFVGGALVSLYEGFRVAVNIIIPIIEFMGEQFGNTIMLIVDLINGDWTAAWNDIKNIVQTNIDFVIGLFTTVLPNALSGVGNDIVNLFSFALDLLIGVFTDKTGTIATTFKNGIINMVADTLEEFAGFIPGVESIADRIRGEVETIPVEAGTAMSTFPAAIQAPIDTASIQAAAAAGKIVPSVIIPVSTIPSGAGTALAPLSPAITGQIDTASVQATAHAGTLVTSAVTQIGTMPSRTTTALSPFASAVTGPIDSASVQAAAHAGTLVTGTVSQVSQLTPRTATAMGGFSPAVVNPISATVSPATSAANRVGTGATSGLSSGMSSMAGNASSVMNGVAASIRNSGGSLASAATSAGAAAVSALNIQLAKVQYTAAQIKAAAASGQLFASSSGSSGGSSSGGNMPSSGHGGSSSSTGSTGIKRQGSDGTGEENVKIREAHATGGIAGYTGWHWMEKNELAIPQATNWDAILINPISDALAKAAQITAGRGLTGSSQGNVNYEGDTYYITANLSSDYDFDKMMDDANRRTTRDRFRRGITS